MTLAKVVLTGLGILFEVIGTLFISFDALRGQQENAKTLEFIAWIFGHSSRLATTVTNPVTQALLSIDPRDNTELAQQQSKLKQFDDALALLEEGDKEAFKIDVKNFQDRIDDASKKARTRAPLIYAAIVLVALGGVLELVAAVFLGG